MINRSSQTRYISVTAGVDEDHNVTLVSDQIQKELDKIKLPDGYEISMTGEDETIRDAMNQLYLMLILAVVFIYLIMVAQFQSFCRLLLLCSRFRLHLREVSLLCL